MTYSTHELEDFSLSLPITQTARRTAQQFANQQPTPEKAEQVRLNTLAVLTVNDYLKMMGIDAQLTGDSWNPVTRLCADVADLEVAGLGRLECRPVSPAMRTCSVPPEVWEERIGYVVVKLDEAAQAATILGFVPEAAVEELPLSQLQPVEDLVDHLERLSSPAFAAQAAAVGQALANLSQWLQGAFEAGWQTVDAVINPPQLAYRFRNEESAMDESSVRRAKLIDLGIQFANRRVALVVELNARPDGQMDIRLQVHPSEGNVYLPEGVYLRVLDEADAVFLEAQSRHADNYIQLRLSGATGERFRAQVALGDASVVEEFVI